LYAVVIDYLFPLDRIIGQLNRTHGRLERYAARRRLKAQRALRAHQLHTALSQQAAVVHENIGKLLGKS
jgi:hypothetical protein